MPRQAIPQYPGIAWDAGSQGHWCAQVRRPGRLKAGGQNGIDVQCVKGNTLIFYPPPWNHFQILKQGFRFHPAVGLYNADNHVFAAVLQYMCFIEHGIRFSDARGIAEKYL